MPPNGHFTFFGDESTAHHLMRRVEDSGAAAAAFNDVR
jgi:hypothetical protein